MVAHNVSQDVQVFALCAIALYLKFLVTCMIQGRKGFVAGTRAPEDDALPMAKGAPKQGFDFVAVDMPQNEQLQLKAAMDDEKRWKRIIQNDLESMPMAFVVFMGSIFVGGNVQINSIAMVVYSIARMTHTIVYAQHLPRARMLSWMIGVLCIVTTGVNGAYAVLV